MSTPYHNLSDEQLVHEIKEITADKAAIEKELKTAKEALYQRRQAEIESLLKEKPEPYGVVNLTIGSDKVKIDTPKKVEWDEDKLEAVAKEIEKDGADPKEYIEISYKVSETKYKAWPQNIKDYFVDARTIKAGNPTITIEEAKAA